MDEWFTTRLPNLDVWALNMAVVYSSETSVPTTALEDRVKKQTQSAEQDGVTKLL